MRKDTTAWEGLRALWWLDWTAFRNRIRNLLREPKRLWPWLLFSGWIALVVVGRASATGHGQAFEGLAAAAPVAGALLPGAYLVLLGLIWHGAARRAPAAFSSPADGRFLLGSDLPPKVVVLWMQFRQTWGLVRGVALNALVWLAVLLPSAGVTAKGILLGMVGILLAALLLFAVRLPIFVLARRWPKLPVAFTGIAVGAVGAVAIGWQAYSALGTGQNFVAALARQHVALPLGDTVAAAIGGGLDAMAILLALTLAATALSVIAAGDCYPEIWESSTRAFAVRRLARRGRLGLGLNLRTALEEAGVGQPRKGARRTSASSTGRRVPGGSWVLLWREWLIMRRSPSGLRGAAAWLLAAAVAGVLVGRFAAQQHHAYVEGIIVGVAVYPALFLSTASGVSLAADLRRPLWWLSSEGLLQRLAVWTLATSARGMGLLIVGLVAAAIAAGTLPSTVAALPLGLAALWLLRAIGLAVYALFPSQTDMRGPGAALRLMATFVLIAPAAAVAGVIGAVSGNGPLAMAAGALAAAAEGVALVLFAAGRLRGNGMGVAQAEQR